MTRSVALFAIVVVALAGVVAPAGGAPASDPARVPQLAEDAGNQTAPGAMFAGVVDVQEAEVGGELAERAFGLRIARAESNASRASVVAGEVGALRERLTSLEQRRERLEAAYENGNISEARYRAETAALVARSRVLERQIDRTGAIAGALPAELLAEREIDAEEIERLRTGARNLSGPEVSEIARAIAGPPVGSELSERGEGESGLPVDLPGFVGEPGENDRDDQNSRPADGDGDALPLPPEDRPGNRSNATDRAPIESPNGTDDSGRDPTDSPLGEDDDSEEADDDGGEGRER